MRTWCDDGSHGEYVENLCTAHKNVLDCRDAAVEIRVQPDTVHFHVSWIFGVGDTVLPQVRVEDLGGLLGVRPGAPEPFQMSVGLPPLVDVGPVRSGRQ